MNDLPTASNRSYTTSEDTPLVVTPSMGLIAPGTTSDADGDTLFVTANSNPSHGTLAVRIDGGFTYTPAANWHGTDTFTFTVSDGQGGSATATATVTVGERRSPCYTLNCLQQPTPMRQLHACTTWPSLLTRTCISTPLTRRYQRPADSQQPQLHHR